MANVGTGSVWRWVMIAAIAALASCGPSETPKTKPPNPVVEKAVEKQRERLNLLMEKNRTNESFLQQLRAETKITDGFLMVEGSFFSELTLLPATSAWGVSCGVNGLSISFGSAVSGRLEDGSGGVDNESKLELSMVPISVERCRELAPLIGKEIRRIVGEH